ncbi:hypothetical protein HGA92_05375 [Candidatus Gracilibacteria bacterium]|nr:hypothetical protein [Candidatus Gracilibacteria bacterium]NUJ99063.1 hypothetical protein [Candidatus Gracilibacteria bacterium]
MEKILIEDEYITVSEKDKIITLTWKDATSHFTNELFKQEALKYVETIKTSEVKKIIVDMRKFFFNLSDEIIEWRNKNIIYIYNEYKIEKFAFISNIATINQDNPKNTFITKTFTNKEEAKNWIKL